MSNIDDYCRKAHIDPADLSDAEKRLLGDLTQEELDALVQISKKGARIKPVAWVGSSGF